MADPLVGEGIKWMVGEALDKDFKLNSKMDLGRCPIGPKTTIFEVSLFLSKAETWTFRQPAQGS